MNVIISEFTLLIMALWDNFDRQIITDQLTDLSDKGKPNSKTSKINAQRELRKQMRKEKYKNRQKIQEDLFLIGYLFL